VLSFIIGVSLSCLIFAITKNAAHKALQEKFEYAATQNYLLIEQEVRRNISLLHSLKGFILAAHTVSRSQFQAFSTAALKTSPSVQMLAWLPAIPVQEREAFEQSVQAEGYSNYQIMDLLTSGELTRSKKRERYFPIYFIEPMQGNLQAFGFDPASENRRRTTLAKAEEMNLMQVSPILRLVQEIGQQQGAIFTAPVFSAKNGQLSGYVMLSIRLADLVYASTRSTTVPRKLLIEIQEANQAIQRQSTKTPDSFLFRKPLTVLNSEWDIIITPDRGFLPRNWFSPSLLYLMTGLIFSSLLSYLLWRSSFDKDKLSRKLRRESSRLQSSEERFMLAMQESQVGLWDWYDVNGEEEFWSDSFYTLLGYRPGDIPSTLSSFRSLLHPEDIDRIFKLLDDHFKRNIRYSIEYRMKIKSGQYRWFRGTAHTARDADGNPVRMVGTIQDIHEQKTTNSKTEEVLTLHRNAVSRLEAITQAVSDAIIMIDPVGRITEFSETAETMFGYTRQEVIGENIKMMMPDTYSFKHDEHLRSYRRTRIRKVVGHVRQVYGQRKDGSEFPLELRVAEMKGPQTGYVGLIRDIS